jgi:hypothetical protein
MTMRVGGAGTGVGEGTGVAMGCAEAVEAGLVPALRTVLVGALSPRPEPAREADALVFMGGGRVLVGALSPSDVCCPRPSKVSSVAVIGVGMAGKTVKRELT